MLLIAVILTFFPSCEQFEQGGLRFEYSWSDAEGKAIEPPALDDLYAWAELTYKGEQKTTGPVAMADEDAALRFENLPYETGMVMKMTIRISEIKNKAPEARTDNVVYFCTSEEFELKRGKVTVVKNGCKMEPGPALSEDNKPSSPELKIVYSKGSNKIEVSSETEMKTPSNKVEVLFKAPNDLFNTVILANDTGFAIGKKEFPRPEKGSDGYYRIGGYDLNEGLPVTNDGSRIVAIKLRNAEGFESLQSSITVFLDTSAPVLNVKNDASAYNGSGTVVVTVSSNETLKGKPVTGLWDSNSKLIGILTEEAEELQKGTSYRYQIPVMDNLTDGSYTIKVKGIDIVDNMSDDFETEPFAVDSIAPELEGAPAITPERVAQDTEYTVTFKTKDDMSKGKVAVLRKEDTLTCTSEGNDYTCKGTAPEGTGDSIDPVVISLTDEAGNLASFNAGNLIIDRTAPAVSGDATVIVTKPAGCPLSSVTAAIGGSSVDASFIVNEILAGDPVVRAVKDTDIIPLVLNSQIGYFYSFTAENIDTGSIADGTYEIEIELVDEAGNQSKTVSSSFNIITIKPAVPAVDVADTIIYRRIPWGSDATGGIKYYSIKAGANAVDANTSWVYAFDGSDPATASEIGKAQVTNKTFSEFELNRADRTEVYIAAYDTACNRSDAVKVRDVEWIATMGYKEPGDSFKNPHSFYTTGFMSPTLEQKSVAQQEPFDGGLANIVRSGSGSWDQRKDSSEEPTGREGHAMAYDNLRGKMLLFGGFNGLATTNETWEWDGMIWTRLNPTTKPSARGGHGMVYDSARGKVFLFGGSLESSNDETWEWDGANWTRKTPVNKPSARSGHAMAYDSVRGKVVLFGGGGNSVLNDETWEWDGTNWMLMSPVTKPAARLGHAMVYDSARKRVVMFGGDTGTSNNETWEWDGTDWKQVKGPESATCTGLCICTADTCPAAQNRNSMSYDSARGKVVMFKTDQTWEWDGVNWTRKYPVAQPSARYRNMVTYNSVSGRTILFGGCYTTSPDFTYYKELWEWDGTNWTQINSGTKPSARSGHAMTYDTARGKAVLFGGSQGGNETWEWDGANWTQKNPANKPSARSSHAMTYDTARGKVVLFGGSQGGNETWEWDGVNWLQKNPANKPSNRSGHAMAYDSVLDKVLLFGGFNGSVSNNETWEWDGANWTQVKGPASPTCVGTCVCTADTCPTERNDPAMVFDSTQGRIILFGGYTLNGYDDETWEWDGVNWTQMNTAIKPIGRSAHAMAYDSSRARVILFGGFTGGAFSNDTWEWGDGQWELKNTGNNPPVLFNHALAYDVEGEKTILFGGGSEINTYDETWLFNSGGNDRAGHIINVSWESTGITDEENIQSLSILFNAGGIGDYTGTPYEGVDLLAWMHDRWVTVSYNEAGIDSLEPVTWETTDPVEIQTILNSGLRKFNFAVVPTAPNGFLTDMGTIATDYAEVIVRYKISK